MTKLSVRITILLLLLGSSSFAINSDNTVDGKGNRTKGKTLTFGAVVQRYVDLKALASFPVEGEKSGMVSSYDRKSKYDVDRQQYVNWSANYDGDGYEGKEGEDYILAHLKGPGVVNRFWSAKPEAGNITIEIDGKEVLTMPAEHLFDGQHAPFNFPGFVYTSAKGKNNYIPICFQRECKIKASKDWGQFYQINYTLFPENYNVPSFNGAFSDEEEALLREVEVAFVNSKDKVPYVCSGVSTETKSINLPADDSEVLFLLSGRKAITRFESDLMNNQFIGDLLRNIQIEIYWDGSAKPSISCPLGAFFGASVHDWNKLSEYTGVPLGMNGRMMYSNWYMPFERNAKIVLVNNSGRKIPLKGRIDSQEIKGKSDKQGYFHVQWNDGLQKIEEERWPDRLLLDLQGCGRFCGMMLSVFNPVSGIEYGYNLTKFNAPWWWGEGDEKFYVDGEKFPSTFGTGTEDYFGYAWGWPVRFSRPFHNQTYTTTEGLSDKDAPHFVKNGNRVVSLNRFQIMDNVPFMTSFYATMEQYYSDERPIKYQAAMYYYLDQP
ncbi:DUF2961 domain-containing protein [Puteibacter caeruleilacunae]|nr:DUF2961 domain-containing protein [Puteibacter caeruleilacunae]